MSYLAENVHALEETEEDTDPGEGERDNELPAEASEVLDAVRDLQHMVSETTQIYIISHDGTVLYIVIYILIL